MTRMWNPTWDQLAQCNHFFIGVSIVFGSQVFFQSIWWGWAAVACWCAVKEFVFDPLVEGATIFDGVVDSGWYVTGAAVAGAGVLMFI